MTLLEGLEQKLRQGLPELELRKNEPMSKHTSFRVGGPATLMALPKTPGEVADLMKVCGEQGITPFFMGNGSNLLVSDQGYDGLIIGITGLDRLSRNEDIIYAWSGVSLARLAQFAVQEGLSGLEWASGIPGTVGGAVYMNAGAYGGEMAGVLDCISYCGEKGPGSFKVMDGKLFHMFGVPSGEKDTLTISYREEENSAFSYRHSYFCDRDILITAAEFCLTPDDPAAIRARMEELGERRKAKQPLEYPSAGSTFKRPPAVDGKPVYAAALIDQCGCKGLTVGGAQVSEKHAGFIINKGGATCADILALVEEVKRRVYDQTGVALELEVKTLGV